MDENKSIKSVLTISTIKRYIRRLNVVFQSGLCLQHFPHHWVVNSFAKISMDSVWPDPPWLHLIFLLCLPPTVLWKNSCANCECLHNYKETECITASIHKIKQVYLGIRVLSVIVFLLSLVDVCLHLLNHVHLLLQPWHRLCLLQ